MKNLKIVYPKDISGFVLNNVWSSDIFKNMHLTYGSIIDLLIKKISDAPIFFYEMSDEKKERNSLTSFARLISYRKYANIYINDLYYFHELMHLATYQCEEGISFEAWKHNISTNELLASLYSEAFIYIMCPDLLNKTFDDLWVKRFISDSLISIDSLGVKLDLNNTCDKNWLKLYNEEKINHFDINPVNWSNQMNFIINERMTLRGLTDKDKLDSAQLSIVKYNKIRDNWLSKWEIYYKDINKSINNFVFKDKSVESYLAYIESVSCADNIPFYKVLP